MAESFEASRPHIGDEISYMGKVVGRVTRVEGNLCWHSGYEHGPFIWRFNDGVNALHTWARKVDRNAPCPGWNVDNPPGS